MRFVSWLVLGLFTFIPLGHAGYSADNCKGETNRVRADLIFDLKSGTIIAEKNAKAAFHPASLTKLVSLMVIFDAIHNDEIKYTDRVALVRTAGNLDNRTSMIKSMTVKEAVSGIVTGSLNNALDGIAVKIGQDKFIKRMNDKAHAIGLKHTKFVNTTGWPTPASKTSQRTNLYELAAIMRHLEDHYAADYKKFDGQSSVTIRGVPNPLKSTNNLLQNASSRRAQPYKGVVGGKTGYTCYSGWHLITIYKDPADTQNRLVLMSVGHSTGSARDKHMRTLLDKNIPLYQNFLKKNTGMSNEMPASIPHPRDEFKSPPQTKTTNASYKTNE